ncbi:hypothetical protein AXF42_Ash001394 [Apostasia shenzhenica]|uniref:Transposase-associated domain-containing protein n=1 Tax=Apostasia shenzhenica TaxID=1088818 RepID=A0A2I0AUS9_9ASPA|nr:hypothetical protein AXF42_Ash001394 [Apostasia shenzhenica]
MDRSWIKMNKRSFEYDNGVNSFIDFALKNEFLINGRIRCPCLRCGNMKLFEANIVKDYLFFYGFDETYKRWILHGESVRNEMNNIGRSEELLQKAKSPLYPNCKSFTKLSTLMCLFNLNAANGLSNKCFTELLILIKDMLPAPNQLPNSTYEVKKMLRKLGMHYKKINVCPNNCILYRNEYSGLK